MENNLNIKMDVKEVNDSTDAKISPRIQALHKYQVLDTGSDIFFRNIAEAITKVFNCKLGIISFVDDEKVFYKEVAVANETLPDFTGAYIPLSQSPCSFAIKNSEITVISKYPPQDDPLWVAYNVQVTKFGLRFYAGAPLRTSEGHSIGMLAFVDEDARIFTERDGDLLKTFAKIVVDELELRLAILLKVEEQKEMNQSLALKNEEIEVRSRIIREQNDLNANLNEELLLINRQLSDSNNLLLEKINEKSSKLLKALKSLVISQRDLDALIYNASHGLKSPVSALEGLMNLATIEVRDPISLSYFEKVSILTRRMQGIIKKLATLYNITHKGQKTHQAVQILLNQNFKTILQNIIGLYKKEIEVNKVEINLTIGPFICFPGVAEYFIGIFENLLENALNFCKDANTYQGWKASIDISVFEVNDQLHITFADNGEGIPVGSQAMIFEMFFRASVKSAGVGLGLYIVKKAVESMNGKIHVESKYGHGTLFTIIFPKPQSVN